MKRSVGYNRSSTRSSTQHKRAERVLEIADREVNDKSLTFSQSSVVSSAGWTCSTGTSHHLTFRNTLLVRHNIEVFFQNQKGQILVMESSRFPSGNNLRWLSPLDPVMLAAAAAGSVTQMGLMDSVSSSSSISDSSPSRFAPLVYQHLFHHLPPPRNQQNFDFLTYHAAALHQHLAVAAAASNRTFQQCQQQFSPAIMNRMPFAGAPDASFLEGDRSSKKSATIGYSVADLLSDHQRPNSCDRVNNTSPEHSGKYWRI